jgi:hypothetical protein
MVVPYTINFYASYDPNPFFTKYYPPFQQCWMFHSFQLFFLISSEYMFQNSSTLHASKFLCCQLPKAAISAISNAAYPGSYGLLCGSSVLAALDEFAGL